MQAPSVLTTDREIPNGCYFESHIGITIKPDEKDRLNDFVNNLIKENEKLIIDAQIRAVGWMYAFSCFCIDKNKDIKYPQCKLFWNYEWSKWISGDNKYVYNYVFLTYIRCSIIRFRAGEKNPLP